MSDEPTLERVQLKFILLYQAEGLNCESYFSHTAVMLQSQAAYDTS